MADNDHPTVTGLLNCLRMLADEASTMQFTQTLAAPQQAMETCRFEAVTQDRPHGSALH